MALPYKLSTDIRQAVLWAAGESTDQGVSAWYNKQVWIYINRAYLALALGGREIERTVNEKWWWLRKTGRITLNPVIETGTVAVTNGSDTITFSSAPAISVSGYHIKIGNDSEAYKIISHTGGSNTATIDMGYMGITDSAGIYSMFQLDYNLPDQDILYLMAPLRAFKRNTDNLGYKVYSVELTKMEESFPLAQIQKGMPSFFAPTGETSIRFNKKGLEIPTRIEYDYIYLPDELTDDPSSEPVTPIQYRSIIADFATYMVLLDKNDNRADTYIFAARETLRAMARENKDRIVTAGRNYSILPRAGRTTRRGLLTSSGLKIV